MKTDDVLETIHAVMHLYRSRQYRELRDGPHDLTHMEFKVLAFFARRPGATQRQLVEHSGRDKAQIARLIQGLRNRGLLEGSADALDKRSVCLSLSAAGQAVYAEVAGQGRHLSEVAVRGFSAQEREQLQGLLARVEANLQGE